jgi:hypothetical protein
MKKFRRGLIAGAVGLAVLVPTGVAVAETVAPADNPPICTAEERAERWAVRDELRTQALERLRQEGVTDPAQVHDQLRLRLHDGMEQRFGEMNGPHAGHRFGQNG